MKSLITTLLFFTMVASGLTSLHFFRETDYDLSSLLYMAVEKGTKIQLKRLPLQQVNNPSLCSQQRDTKCWTWRQIIRSYYYILRRG